MIAFKLEEMIAFKYVDEYTLLSDPGSAAAAAASCTQPASTSPLFLLQVEYTQLHA